MLIPQYSIRWLFGVTAVCGVAFTFVGLAVRGHTWALGVSVAIGAFCLAMLLYAAMFGLLWLFSLVFVPPRQTAGSPFAPSMPQGGGENAGVPVSTVLRTNVAADGPEEAVDAILVD